MVGTFEFKGFESIGMGSSFWSRRTSMDKWSWTGVGLLLPSLTVTIPVRTFNFWSIFSSMGVLILIALIFILYLKKLLNNFTPVLCKLIFLLGPYAIWYLPCWYQQYASWGTRCFYINCKLNLLKLHFWIFDDSMPNCNFDIRLPAIFKGPQTNQLDFRN